ncbi:hypothetical protein OSB04_un001366 [Centaurea solstitialis]|uniref:Uncharacterized protein n=1 Tax=Centaurea solstitialis TaxID=347529 RepID=A0AA38W2P0_9ASTR|nr:hypothetical protein OSB04_un001366 [Centaurea solstitialis]
MEGTNEGVLVLKAQENPTWYSHNVALLSSTSEPNASGDSATFVPEREGANGSILEAFLASHASLSLTNDDLEQIHPHEL